MQEKPRDIRLRGMKRNPIPFSYIHHRETYFDIFFQSRVDDGVYLHWPRIIVPYDEFFPAKPVMEGSGLMLPNLNFKKYLPPRVPCQVEDFEIEIVETRRVDEI